MILANCRVKEDLLTLLTLKVAARRSDVYNAHRTFFVDNSLKEHYFHYY